MDQFVNEVRAAATLVRQMGMPISVPVVVAQAILESNVGRSKLATQCNNLFGVKGDYNGNYCEFETWEWSPERGHYRTPAKFRRYKSWFEALADYGELINRLPFYADAAAAADSPLDYLRGILVERNNLGEVIEPGWATDPDYESKIIKIMDDYNLLDDSDAVGAPLVQIYDGDRLYTLEGVKVTEGTTNEGRPKLQIRVVPTTAYKRARYFLGLDKVPKGE